MKSWIEREFIDNRAVPSDAQIGIVCVVVDREAGISVLVGHNSPSMVVSFRTGAGDVSRTLCSRLAKNQTVAVMEWLVLRLATR